MRENSIIQFKIFKKFPCLKHGSTTKFCSFDNLLKKLSFSDDKYIMPKQMHGDKVILVAKDIVNKAEDNCEGDALICNESGIALVVRTADCLPIFLYNPNVNVIGLIHAGWRGLAQDIIGKAINQMIGKFNIKTEFLYVAIGPSIKKECYQVGEDVVESLASIYKNFIDVVIQKVSSQKWNLDLKLVAIKRLEELGITKSNIEISFLCTHCYPDLFYSYRHDGQKLGDIFSVIGLKK